MAIYFILLNLLALFFWLIDYHILGKNGIVKSFFKIEYVTSKERYSDDYYAIYLKNESFRLHNATMWNIQKIIKDSIFILCFNPLFSLLLYVIISEKYWFFYITDSDIVMRNDENKVSLMTTLYFFLLIINILFIIYSLILLNR